MNRYLQLAEQVALAFQGLPLVEAIALGGSNQGNSADTHSDIDVYIYSDELIPIKDRRAIVDRLGASKADLNLTFWDPGDEWYHRETGIEVDLVYWTPAWIEEQLDRVVVKHQASMGYSTCFWRTVRDSRILFDRKGWFADLKKRVDLPYPEELKRAVIEKNYSVLRDVIPSYYNQIQKALKRGDLISLNHRLAAFLSSYFDILFALNKVLHPGEKKLLEYVEKECSRIPKNLGANIAEALAAAAQGNSTLLDSLDRLLSSLDEILKI